MKKRHRSFSDTSDILYIFILDVHIDLQFSFCIFMQKRWGMKLYSANTGMVIGFTEAAHQRCSSENVLWKYVANLQEKNPFESVISIKLQSNLIEIALRDGSSPVNLLHIFKTTFPRNTSGWLLLDLVKIILMLCFLLIITSTKMYCLLF